MASQRRQPHWGTSLNLSARCPVGKSQLGTSWYITTTSHIGRFFYVPVRRHRNASNRPVLVTYQLRRRGYVSAWQGHSNLGTMQYVFWHLRWFSLIKVSIGTSSQPLNLVGFIYIPMRRCKDVTNRSVSFTYQLQHHDDVSAWSVTSRPILDLNETSLRCRMLCEGWRGKW